MNEATESPFRVIEGGKNPESEDMHPILRECLLYLKKNYRSESPEKQRLLEKRVETLFKRYAEYKDYEREISQLEKLSTVRKKELERRSFFWRNLFTTFSNEYSPHVYESIMGIIEKYESSSEIISPYRKCFMIIFDRACELDIIMPKKISADGLDKLMDMLNMLDDDTRTVSDVERYIIKNFTDEQLRAVAMEFLRSKSV